MTDEMERPLTAAERVRTGAMGRSFKARGEDWLLPHAYTAEFATEMRQVMFEAACLKGKYDLHLIYTLASSLLIVNYDLTDQEAFAVVVAADPKELRDRLEECLLVTCERDQSYDDWVRSALIANGLEPTAIEDRDLPHVMAQLVMTGRAVPYERFVDAAVAGLERKKLLSLPIPRVPVPVPTEEAEAEAP